MRNELKFETGETMEILRDLMQQRAFVFDDLTAQEKIALNEKELIEDDYFIVLHHHQKDVRRRIDGLCPLNFYVNDDYDLVAYCEDDPNWREVLPSDTTLKINRI